MESSDERERCAAWLEIGSWEEYRLVGDGELVDWV